MKSETIKMISKLALAIMAFSVSGFIFSGDKPEFLPASKDSGNNYQVGVDPTVSYTGEPSRFIKATDSESGISSVHVRTIDGEKYRGKKLLLTGYIKPQDVKRRADLWVQFKGSMNNYRMNGLFAPPVHGTTDWILYEVTLHVPGDNERIDLGFLLDGTGQVWLDGMEFQMIEEES